MTLPEILDALGDLPLTAFPHEYAARCAFDLVKACRIPPEPEPKAGTRPPAKKTRKATAVFNPKGV